MTDIIEMTDIVEWLRSMNTNRRDWMKRFDEAAAEIELLRSPDRSSVCLHCGEPLTVAHCVFIKDGKQYQGTDALLEEIERLRAALERIADQDQDVISQRYAREALVNRD